MSRSAAAFVPECASKASRSTGYAMATRALREPRAHGHAATVLDLGLPRVEGMDVLQRIRRPSCA